MNFEILTKFKWAIILIAALIGLIMMVVAFKSPQPFLSGFIGILGTVLGASITQFTKWHISQQERMDKFRLAALDKRLETQQKAYSYWYELLWSLNNKDRLDEMIMKCQDFWKDNCLYLDPESRKSLKKTISNAIFLEQYNETVTATERQEVIGQIYRTGEDLQKGVGLPPIIDTELKMLL